jgi:hypothetical protein
MLTMLTIKITVIVITVMMMIMAMATAIMIIVIVIMVMIMMIMAIAIVIVITITTIVIAIMVIVTIIDLQALIDCSNYIEEYVYLMRAIYTESPTYKLEYLIKLPIRSTLWEAKSDGWRFFESRYV